MRDGDHRIVAPIAGATSAQRAWATTNRTTSRSRPALKALISCFQVETSGLAMALSGAELCSISISSVAGSRKGRVFRLGDSCAAERGDVVMLSRLLCLTLATLAAAFTLSCSRGPSEASPLPESELYPAYLQAGKCLVIKASLEEKRLLVTRIPVVDANTPGSVDLLDKRGLRFTAPVAFDDALSAHCPASLKRLRAIEKGLDPRTRSIGQVFIFEFVQTMIAINIADADTLQKSFEVQYGAFGY
jgi:hypothetical protein